MNLVDPVFNTLSDVNFAFAGNSSTVPISRMYMRTGSVVRPFQIPRWKAPARRLRQHLRPRVFSQHQIIGIRCFFHHLNAMSLIIWMMSSI